jgi:hemolysin III
MRTRDHFSAISHLVGAALSIAGMTLLIALAAQRGEIWQVIGFSVFGASVLLLYMMSGLYHFFHVSSRARRVFERLDHSFIFVLIAGTFTPLCLTVLRGPWGWTLLGVIWACAIIGIVVKNIWRVPQWISTSYYVFMGWLAVIPIVPLYHALPFMALVWLFLGGVFYTVGAMFYALDLRYPSHRWFNMHDVFHVLVMMGSLSHFVLMWYLV